MNYCTFQYGNPPRENKAKYVAHHITKTHKKHVNLSYGMEI